MTQDASGPVLIFGGAGGGIGEALARRLRAAGLAVAVTSRTLDRAQVLASEIGATPLTCDVRDDASVEAAVAAGTVMVASADLSMLSAR